jgi:hypothetical protein
LPHSSSSQAALVRETSFDDRFQQGSSSGGVIPPTSSNGFEDFNGEELDTSSSSCARASSTNAENKNRNDRSALKDLTTSKIKNLNYDYDDDDSDGFVSTHDVERQRQTCSQKLAKCCSAKTVKKRLPIFDWLPKTTLDTVICDLVAGLSVGLTVIPHGFAFATLAGIPVQVNPSFIFFSCK